MKLVGATYLAINALSVESATFSNTFISPTDQSIRIFGNTGNTHCIFKRWGEYKSGNDLWLWTCDAGNDNPKKAGKYQWSYNSETGLIKSAGAEQEGLDFCWEIKKKDRKSKQRVKIRECDSTNELQQFDYNNGRIHSRANAKICAGFENHQWEAPTGKVALTFQDCYPTTWGFGNEGSVSLVNENMSITPFDWQDSTCVFKKYSGYKPNDQVWMANCANLASANQFKSDKFRWSFDANSGLVKSIGAENQDMDLCWAISDKNRNYKQRVKLMACDGNNEKQVFDYFDGRLHLRARDRLCVGFEHYKIGTGSTALVFTTCYPNGFGVVNNGDSTTAATTEAATTSTTVSTTASTTASTTEATTQSTTTTPSCDMSRMFNPDSTEPTFNAGFTVKIKTNDDDTCTGSWISPNHILTSATCKFGGNNYKIFDQSSNQIASANKNNFIRHPSFNSNTATADIGIIHVCGYTFTGTPVSLPNQSDSQSFSELHATGFGVPDYNSEDYADEMEWGTLTVKALSVCKNKFNNLGSHDDASLICTKGSTGVCWGDEGAPLITVNGDCEVEQRGVAGAIQKCASNQPQFHAKIDIQDFPWNAVIYLKGFPDCGGSVISPNWILTVGHCTNGAKISKTKIVVGVSNYQGATQHAVSEIITNPTFQDSTTINDVGLIKLASPLDLTNSNIRAVCLPRKDMCLSSSEHAWITGWGATKANGQDSPKDLHGAEIPIMTSQYCKQKYGNEYHQGSMTCAADGTGTDGCDGDSGSPLTHVNNGVHTIWGMNSWSNMPCASGGFPGVYNRVAAFTQFVYDNTGVRLAVMGQNPGSVCGETVTQNLN